jgi:hypothetical protein
MGETEHCTSEDTNSKAVIVRMKEDDVSIIAKISEVEDIKLTTRE